MPVSSSPLLARGVLVNKQQEVQKVLHILLTPPDIDDLTPPLITI